MSLADLSTPPAPPGQYSVQSVHPLSAGVRGGVIRPRRQQGGGWQRLRSAPCLTISQRRLMAPALTAAALSAATPLHL